MDDKPADPRQQRIPNQQDLERKMRRIRKRLQWRPDPPEVPPAKRRSESDPATTR